MQNKNRLLLKIFSRDRKETTVENGYVWGWFYCKFKFGFQLFFFFFVREHLAWTIICIFGLLQPWQVCAAACLHLQ